MTHIIVRVYRVNSADKCIKHKMDVDPQTKPTNLGCESTCSLLSSTSTTITIYYYSAQKLILILLYHVSISHHKLFVQLYFGMLYCCMPYSTIRLSCILYFCVCVCACVLCLFCSVQLSFLFYKPSCLK